MRALRRLVSRYLRDALLAVTFAVVVLGARTAQNSSDCKLVRIHRPWDAPAGAICDEGVRPPTFLS